MVKCCEIKSAIDLLNNKLEKQPVSVMLFECTPSSSREIGQGVGWGVHTKGRVNLISLYHSRHHVLYV